MSSIDEYYYDVDSATCALVCVQNRVSQIYQQSKEIKIIS